MRDLLSNLEKRRWDWAKRGIEDFRKGFLRLKDSGGEKNRVLIGVYGPTQVGKTTFILKIIGIREDKIAELSTALRGRRESGNSATVTSTVYQRSKSDKFVLHHPDGLMETCSTISGLEDAMMRVRKTVEGANGYSLKPITIQIAKSYFNMEKIELRSQDIEILDLPGDDSREEQEVMHVERCLKEYLPQCRICILMEIASQLITLTQIDRNYVKDWMWLPSRFRIVLTRATTSSSIRKKIKSGEFGGVSSFRQEFEDELGRYLNQKSKDVKIYPLEFGDSWDYLKTHDREMYERCSPWIDDIFEELVEDLASSYSPSSEIEQMKNMESLAVKRSEEEYDSFQRIRGALYEKRQDKRRSYKSERIKRNLFKEEIVHIESDRKKIGKIAIQKPQIDEGCYKVDGWCSRGFDEQRASSLKNDYMYNQDRLQQEYGDMIQTWNRSMKRMMREYDPGFKGVELEFFSRSFNITGDRLLDRYIMKNGFCDDLIYCEAELKKVNDETYDFMKNICERKKKLAVKNLQDSIRSMEWSIGQCQDKMQKIQEKIERIDSEIKDTDEKIKKAREEWNADIERSQSLDEFLKRAFLEESENIRKKIFSADTVAEEKWAYHQYWNIITGDAERVVASDG